jgi:hypothetical protein
MYGMDSKVGISFQNSYGTSNVASLHWLQPISDSVALKKADIVRKGLRGIYGESAHIEGANSVAGDISIEADGISAGVLLSAVMNRTTATSGSLYSHVFKPRTADFDTTLCAERPFTYHKHLGDTGSAHLYSDMCGESLDITIANGQLLTMKMSMLGGTYAQAAASAATYYTGVPLDWSVTSLSIAGVARNNIDSMTVSYKNALAAKNTLMTGKYPDRVKRTGPQVIDVSGTLLFDNQTDLQNFISQTRQRLVVNAVGTLNITSGYNETLTIDVPSLLINDFPQGVPGPGELSVSFKGSGEYNVGSACAIAITLVNSKAGY